MIIKYIIFTSLYVEVVFLKWSKSQLARLDIPNFTFHESIVLDSNFIESIPNLLDLKDVVVEGKGHYLDELDTLRLEIKIKGIMVVPCARSLEPVDYLFESVDEAEYSFRESQNDECIIVKGNVIDITDLVKEIISLETLSFVLNYSSAVKNTTELDSGEFLVISKDILSYTAFSSSGSANYQGSTLCSVINNYYSTTQSN
jgi:uncharacterized protein